MSLHKTYLAGSIAISMALCLAQVKGSTVLILASLAAYLALLGWTCSRNYTLPILLFFLPWSPLMRTNPTSFSFFTFGLVLVCVISVLKKRFQFKRYHIAAGILLAFMTLLSKLLDGNWISFNYIAFMMLIVLFPVVKEESTERQYDFYQCVLFFSLGIIVAALCAQHFATYANIRKYINIHSYLTITRMMGFYGDPNFYAAQITAALGGCLYASLNESAKRRTVWLCVLILFLMYCGFMSGSKSFVLVTAVMLVLWVIEMLRMRGRIGRKILLILFGVLAAGYIASSAIFGGWIDVILTRFSFSTNLSTLTTGRMELWQNYLNEIMGEAKILFLGKGFTNVKVNDRGSHSTVIQSVYQLGILGVPVLIMWFVCFFSGLPKMSRLQKKSNVSIYVLVMGAFLPWMAIDAMFFDEFFLLPWYVFIALQGSVIQPVALEEEAQRRIRKQRRQKIRIVW